MPSAAVRKRAERNASLPTGNRMRPSLSISSSVRMNMADLPSHGRPMLGERRCARNSGVSGKTGTHGPGDDPAVLPEATGAPEAGLAGRAARSRPKPGLDRPIPSVPHCERFQVPEATPRENREGGERPARAPRCDGDYPDMRPGLRLGRRSDGMNLIQKTGLEAIERRRGRAVARILP